MTAVEAPFVLSSGLSTPPAATLTNALAAGGRHFSLLTDSSIVIFAIRRYPDRLVVAATIPCPDGPEAHAWAQDGSLLVIASSRRIQIHDPHDAFRLLHSWPTYYIPTSLAVSRADSSAWRVAIGGANGAEMFAVKLSECSMMFAHKGSHIAALIFTHVTSSTCSLLLAAFDGHIGTLHVPPADNATATIAWLDWLDTTRVTCLSLAPNGRRVCVAGWDGVTQLYELEADTLTRITPHYADAHAARSAADSRSALLVWSPNSARFAATRHTAGASVAIAIPTDGLPEWTLAGPTPSGLVSLVSEHLLIMCDRDIGVRAIHWPLTCTSADPCNLPLHSLLSAPHAPHHQPTQAFLKTSLIWSQHSLSLAMTWASAALTLPAGFLPRTCEMPRFGSPLIALSGNALAIALYGTVFLCSTESKRWTMLMHSFLVQSLCLTGDVLVVLEGSPDTPQLCLWHALSGAQLLRQPLSPPLPPSRCHLVGSPEPAASHALFAVVHHNEAIVGRVSCGETQCSLVQTHHHLEAEAAPLDWSHLWGLIEASKAPKV